MPAHDHLSGSPQIHQNPFVEDIFLPGDTELPGVAEIHTSAMSQCVGVLESLVRSGENGARWGRSGRTILIAAPRAGYGKSHLVARLQSVTERLVAVVSLPLEPSQETSWKSVWSSVWRQYENSPCHKVEKCSLLDELGRYFAASVIARAFAEGGLSPRDLPINIDAIENDFHRIFDPESSVNGKMPAWFSKRADELCESAAPRLSQQWSIYESDLKWWCDVFRHRALGKDHSVEKLVFSLESAEAKRRLGQFLRIASDLRPTAFVADHLDGFFGSASAGMEIAEILTGLREVAPRSVTFLCLNEDVWDSVFAGRIPTAWVDRLSGESASLAGISVESAEALVRARLSAWGSDGDTASAFVRQLRENEDWERRSFEKPLFPREVLRAARQQWEATADTVPVKSAPTSVDQAPPAAGPQAFPPPKVGLGQTFQTSENPFTASPPSFPPPASTGGSSLADAARSLADSARERMAELRNSQPASPPTKEEVAGINPEQIPMASPKPRSFFNIDDPQTVAQAAAAGAAGKGLTDIDAIVAEIRGGGSRALSELPVPQKKVNGTNGHHRETAVQTEEAPENPFWARNSEQRLQDLENEELSVESMQWEPSRIASLVRKIGDHYPAVGQEVMPLESNNGAGYLKWTVKGYQILLGFESPQRPGYWGSLLQQAMAERWVTKVAVLSHHSDPFDYRAITSVQTDQAVAMRYFDVIELTDGDLALLYASDRFLKEGGQSDSEKSPLQIVARRLDPFWRRLTSPISATA